LKLTFYSDLQFGGTELDAVQGMTPIGLAGPGNPLANFYWKQVSINPAQGIATGLFGLAPGYSVTRQVYVYVVDTLPSSPNQLNTTITSQAVLSSASYGIAITATVDTFIYSAPYYTPTPTWTPTPIVGMGQVAAYPQPASDTVCFAYVAPQGGD